MTIDKGPIPTCAKEGCTRPVATEAEWKDITPDECSIHDREVKL